MNPLAFPVAIGSHPVLFDPAMANRHGLITGATGTGKTVTLQVLAENFSRLGVPVFMADVKGDLSGISQAGQENAKILARQQKLGMTNVEYRGAPTVFWDVYGEQGHPLRTTISELGPLLLSRLLNLNETQQGVLNAVFKIADDQGLLLLDLKDLRAMLQHTGENARQYSLSVGNISVASVGAIQRALLALESEGGGALLGEPALDVEDLLQTDVAGRGVINILSADTLIHSPKTYATLLLWLLSELFERLPERGDADRPRLVFFFDEAHLLFGDAPKVLQDKVEQVVRLIRSKGVGVYFVTQHPGDIPDAILGQLGNRVQHALRAYTPRDRRALKAAADSLRDNPAIDEMTAIADLGVGEALVSLLDAQGRPGVVERALVAPPASRIGPITAQERQRLVQGSDIYGHYEAAVDRESAYEILKKRAEQGSDPVPAFPEAPRSAPAAGETTPAREKKDEDAPGFLEGLLGGGSSRREGAVEAFTKSAARAVGGEVGRRIIRGVLGSMLGGRKR